MKNLTDVLHFIESIPAKKCSECTHPFAAHHRRWRGYWACGRSGCRCLMFMDGTFPIPVKEG